jgi:transglutaminase-like putative cysteine protease
LSEFINSEFSFELNVTSVSTTAQEVWELKRGVCQDFTHLFIAICRFNNIPTRYVSGYLNQGKSFVGSSLMHAWAEFFIPENGWYGIDVTNNLLVDDNYIRVASGADYTDCSPLKGVLRTNGLNSTHYTVEVNEV